MPFGDYKCHTQSLAARRVVWNGCKTRRILFEAPLPLKPPNVKLKAKHNTTSQNVIL